MKQRSKLNAPLRNLARFSLTDTEYLLVASGLICISLYDAVKEEKEKLAPFSPHKFCIAALLGLAKVSNVKAALTEETFVTQDLKSLSVGKTQVFKCGKNKTRMISATDLDCLWDSKAWKGRKRKPMGPLSNSLCNVKCGSRINTGKGSESPDGTVFAMLLLCCAALSLQ